jgi:hypothetical protein
MRTLRPLFGKKNASWLAFGNATAAAPRCDLSLEAGKLVTAPRQVAQIATGAADAAKSRSPASAAASFWGPLALVVIVLLVVARLLPKPPNPAA